MCAVYILFVAGMHRLLSWGLLCHPRLCTLFTACYYTAALGCLVAGFQARTALQRGALSAAPIKGWVGQVTWYVYAAHQFYHQLLCLCATASSRAQGELAPWLAQT